MARQTEVQAEQVYAACTQLFQVGETVSFLKVYALLGKKGGQEIVSGHIRAWRKETAALLTAKRENPALPSDLVDLSDKLLGNIWELALSRAEATYQVKLGELALKESEGQVKLDAAADQVEQIERANLALEGDLKAAQATIDARDQALLELETRNRELHATLGARDEQIAALREDNARALATLDNERARHDETLQTTQQHHASELAQVRAQHAAELEQVHTREEDNRRHFLTQVDQLNQANKLQVDHLREQFEGQKAHAEGYRRQAYTARDDASKWQGRCELLQTELEQARKILSKVNKHREKVDTLAK